MINWLRIMIGSRLSLSLEGMAREDGQTLAEYALILALIAVVAVVALVFLGGTITNLFSSVGNTV